MTLSAVFWGIAGGILPALLWLHFWLKQDEHPEPRRRIISSFFGGMLAVVFVIPLQIIAKDTIPNPFWLMVTWVAGEEFMKLAAAWIGGLRTRDDDEPIDPVIYLMTAALGFAAVENTLYLIDPIASGDIFHSVLAGNMRFIGTTLLHIVSSATIGVALGLAFFRGRRARLWHGLIGFIVACALHTGFNLAIMDSNNERIFIIFYAVWIAIIVLALLFEKIKRSGASDPQNVDPDDLVNPDMPRQ